MRKITCIQCPNGCQMIAELKNGYLVSLTGNQCSRGEEYARQELEDPRRTITSTVSAIGLSVNRVPVKTSKPVPKAKITDVIKFIRQLTLNKPVECGEIISKKILGLDIDLVATRTYRDNTEF